MLKCKKKNCTGCGACVYSCPKKAITMLETAEGFLYPHVNENICIKCDLCNKTCPVITKRIESENKKCYAVQLVNFNALKNCASGGAFWGIANDVIKKNGIVFGVKDCGRELAYVGVDTVTALNELIGSKYYQCRINLDNYSEIVESTKTRLTLVSGTPCMVSAIKNLKDINLLNLLTFEILCQGVPDKYVIERYYDEKEEKKGSRIKNHSFRAKDWYVGRNYLNRYEYDNGEIECLIGGEDPLSLSFQRQIFLRESCYSCFYANSERVADFTSGDLWEYDSIKFNKNQGCSVVLCNSNKALNLLKDSKMFIIEEVDENIALKNNIPYHRAVKRPICRNYSYKLLKILRPTLVTKICCFKYYVKCAILRRKR